MIALISKLLQRLLPSSSEERHRGNGLFVSYSHKDRAFVQQLSTYLEQEEIPPWIDNQLQIGESWESVIARRIEGCAALLVVMSPDSRESHYVAKELALAAKCGKSILPVLVAGNAFNELSHLQAADLRTLAWPNYRLIERIRDLSAPGQAPSKIVQRRRVEMFVAMSLRSLMGDAAPIVTVGTGYAIDCGVDLNKSMQELGFDELEWTEFLLMLNEQLPGRDFGLQIGDYGTSRFRQLTDLVEHLTMKMDWQDIRRIDVIWH